ncbi:type VII toxin-antitoxin system MntA family adenylyltransferase antitoxin [Thioalkalivibrio sp.]|uniref:type VII toxin-antitoxin system MntA family adenylyltransferase antitoxin n=1 Tax=Thioalkalivibrio sp. TaxID=2093813 RepID=UPI003565B41F
MERARIEAVFNREPHLEVAVLIGSRCRGTATEASDWDFAIQWSPQLGFEEGLAATERLRAELAETLGTGLERIDLIDLRSARLAMRAVVAEEGCLLKGDGSLAWSHFLLRTWRELEDWTWESTHAA